MKAKKNERERKNVFTDSLNATVQKQNKIRAKHTIGIIALCANCHIVAEPKTLFIVYLLIYPLFLGLSFAIYTLSCLNAYLNRETELIQWIHALYTNFIGVQERQNEKIPTNSPAATHHIRHSTRIAAKFEATSFELPTLGTHWHSLLTFNHIIISFLK